MGPNVNKTLHILYWKELKMGPQSFRLEFCHISRNNTKWTPLGIVRGFFGFRKEGNGFQKRRYFLAFHLNHFIVATPKKSLSQANLVTC